MRIYLRISRIRRHLVLIAILVLALGLRLWGLAFGLPHTLTRPDEDAVLATALRFFSRTPNPRIF